MSTPMLRRIVKHGLFKGKKEISNAEVVERINGIKRKPIGRGSLRKDFWMKRLGFRKEYRRYHGDGESYTVFETGCANNRLWWVRE